VDGIAILGPAWIEAGPQSCSAHSHGMSNYSWSSRVRSCAHGVDKLGGRLVDRLLLQLLLVP
jgi:hypothetical protein